MISWLKQVINPNQPTPAQILQTAPKPKKVTIDGKAAFNLSPSPKINSSLRALKLIMVTAGNNNKFYEMKENSDGTFTVIYGRVGSHGTEVNYPIQQWSKKYGEKVRKGYVDQTHLFTKTMSEIAFADLDDKVVQTLINDLSRYAKQSISKNYDVSADQVTRKQVQQAQQVLDDLVKQLDIKLNVSDFNKKLIELYQIIPRKMIKVKDHLIVKPETEEDLKEIENKLADEQATLDVMRGQVETLEKQQEQPAKVMTLMDVLGLTIEQLSEKKLIAQIKKMMGPQKGKFYRAFKVNNLKTEPPYQAYLEGAKNKKTELFWHGSRNQNWLSILKGGLVLRPANAAINGKMFGYGLYFADKFQKSLNYSSLSGSYWTSGNQKRGFLALYEVHVGKQWKIKNHQPWCYDLSQETLKKKGNYDSLFAKGGADLRNNEYIVYNESQCTVRYLIEVR